MCNVCTSTEHTTDSHPTEAPKKYVNCGGVHKARSKMCNACTKSLGKQKAPGSGTPSGGGKPTNCKKNLKANSDKVKDSTGPMQTAPAKPAKSRRDIENKKDHEDFELRKSCHALLEEAESR
jgi:hypothetical protein